MPTQKEKVKPDIDDFVLESTENKDSDIAEKVLLDDVDLDSLKSSVDAGEIIPTLKIVENEPETMTIISKPYSFESDFGTTVAFKVMYKNMIHSLIVPKSLKFQLISEMIKKKLITIDDVKNQNVNFGVLLNKEITVKKSKGNTKQYKNALLYSVQLHI